MRRSAGEASRPETDGFKAAPSAADLWVMRWLLLLVPIVVLLGAWWGRRSRGARQRQLMLLCQRAGLEFAPYDLRADTAWLPFPIFGQAPSGTENVVWDDRVGTDVYTFDFWYQDIADERSIPGRRRLTCAVVPLPATCPGLRIAPRDMAGDVTRGAPRLGREAGARGLRPAIPRRGRGHTVRGRVLGPTHDGGVPRAARRGDRRGERGRSPPVGSTDAAGAGPPVLRRRVQTPTSDSTRHHEPVAAPTRAGGLRAPLAPAAMESGPYRRGPFGASDASVIGCPTWIGALWCPGRSGRCGPEPGTGDEQHDGGHDAPRAGAGRAR